jgi:hypothetical protein
MVETAAHLVDHVFPRLTVLVLLIHWGTFSGVMAATVAGLMMSLATSGLKRLVGYIDGDNY